MKLTHKIMIISVLLGVASLTMASDAQEHLNIAISHAEDAEIHGRAGHTDALLEHAQESLTHAQAAYKTSPENNQHLAASIKLLEEAISQAKQDHAEVATGQVREALSHMRR